MSEPITISDEARKAAEKFVINQLTLEHVCQLAINSATSPLQKRIEELEKQLHAFTWTKGVPPKWNTDWFIAHTTYGDRVALTKLAEGDSYDYKTADETYIKADKIAKWMPFPNSEYRSPAEAKIESLERQLLAMREALKNLAHADGCYCDAAFAMGDGSHPRHSQECQAAMEAIDSAADLASKYSKREVLEKCVYAMTAGREGPHTWSIWNQAIDAARKELEAK